MAEFLSRELTVDLQWREEELAVMRKQLYLTTQGGIQEKVLLRASLAMIYLDALRKLKLPRKEFVWKLAVYSMHAFRSELNQASNPTVFFTEFLAGFNDRLEEEATFEEVPKTSNLWPDLLIRWLEQLDLEAVTVRTEETRLESLVRNRNQIAHGQKLVVKNREDLDRYAHAALVAMHEVAVGIVTSLELKSYRRKGTPTTVLSHAV